MIMLTDHRPKTHSTSSNIPKCIETAKRHVPDRPRILIVEDHAETALLMEYALHQWYRTKVVSAAAAALLAARSVTYRGVLVDISLSSQRNGIDVLEALRALPAYRRTPMVAITAHALPGDRERFLAAGFDDYLSKPFTTDGLRRAVHGHVPLRNPGSNTVLTDGRAES
jgi:CheY-like chemotaxis protein